MAFNTMDLFMNVSFCKSHVYKHKIDKFILHGDIETAILDAEPQ
jgi:hypothetical protein